MTRLYIVRAFLPSKTTACLGMTVLIRLAAATNTAYNTYEYDMAYLYEYGRPNPTHESLPHDEAVYAGTHTDGIENT